MSSDGEETCADYHKPLLEDTQTESMLNSYLGLYA